MSYKVESREEFDRRIVRCLIESESREEFDRRIVRCLIELRSVRGLLEELQDV